MMMMMTIIPPLARDTSLQFRLVPFVLREFCEGCMGVRFQAALLHAPCRVMGVLKRLGGHHLGGRFCFDGIGAQPGILSNKRTVISFSYRIYQLVLPA